MRYFTIFLLILSIFNLSGCTGNEVKSPYLSITYSEANKQGIFIHFVDFDLTTGKWKDVAHVPMTAQYSLGAIDKKNQIVYYSERDSTGSDQLVKLDLKTKKKEKLTNDLYSLSYLVPLEERIILGATKKGHHNTQLATYDIKSKKLYFWNENDFDNSLETLSYDPFHQQIYASFFSEKERNKNDEIRYKRQTPDVIPPTYQVFKYDKTGTDMKKIYETKEKLHTFAPFYNQSDFMVIASSPTVFKQKKVYALEKDKKTFIDLKGYGAIDNLYYSPDKKGFYFTAETNENTTAPQNALYFYDFNQKQVKKIFEHSGAYINNYLILN
ncbi:hypothetical protein [Aneurinibacillus aneurinilyticus]|uniref:hypothetical protein n=1 Tax=Aneurinibacillus aneurinilyticus TaxID=1391 RepID=UPI0023F38F3F|nr:hypothetical protein [Aneurinibacillus aneurinilyticus]